MPRNSSRELSLSKISHGQMNFYVCQLMSGHIFWGSYRPEEDDVTHTFLVCSCFIEMRRTLASNMGGIAPETIMEVLLSSEVS